MARRELFGHKRLDRASNEFVPLEAKKSLYTRIGESDLASFVHH